MEQDIRPPTSSTSSQSAIQAEWDPTGQSYYGSRANVGSNLHQSPVQTSIDSTQASSEIDDLNLEPDEFWPRPVPGDDSEEDEGVTGVTGVLKRTATAKTSDATSRLKKKILKMWGRSYNSRYDFLPNDQTEQDRNALQHDIVLEMLGGRLHLAPVVNARRVLDLGCGPGKWPLAFASQNPSTFVIGVDIEPINIPYSLPNCMFKVADFTEKWSYDYKFDFIHLRHLGSLPKEGVLTSIYENLSPGGWAEFTEWVVAIQSTRNTFTETSFYKWLTHWKEGLSQNKMTVYYPQEYKPLLTEAGFKNVTERKYAVPINPWPPGKSLQRMGSMMEMNINIILEPMSVPIFIDTLKWAPKDLRSLLAEVRKEIADVNMHAYMTLYVHCVARDTAALPM
ncbi:S-adenosyl-L-methionine-dependent methyltransferase [Nemania sp. FL0031]|nr:S-adenosyl-L-methionine-dependent methyltransferase [Nemania sp. FL0031]